MCNKILFTYYIWEVHFKELITNYQVTVTNFTINIFQNVYTDSHSENEKKVPPHQSSVSLFPIGSYLHQWTVYLGSVQKALI